MRVDCMHERTVRQIYVGKGAGFEEPKGDSQLQRLGKVRAQRHNGRSYISSFKMGWFVNNKPDKLWVKFSRGAYKRSQLIPLKHYQVRGPLTLLTTCTLRFLAF